MSSTSSTSETSDNSSPSEDFTQKVYIITREDIVHESADKQIIVCSDGYVYMKVLIEDDYSGKSSYVRYDVLVLSSSTGTLDEDRYIVHKNGNKLDNRVDNLEWGDIIM